MHLGCKIQRRLKKLNITLNMLYIFHLKYNGKAQAQKLLKDNSGGHYNNKFILQGSNKDEGEFLPGDVLWKLNC